MTLNERIYKAQGYSDFVIDSGKGGEHCYYGQIRGLYSELPDYERSWDACEELIEEMAKDGIDTIIAKISTKKELGYFIYDGHEIVIFCRDFEASAREQFLLAYLEWKGEK